MRLWMRAALPASVLAFPLGLGGCGTGPTDGIAPGPPIPLGTIEGTFHMEGAPVAPTGGIVTLVPITGDGTVYQIHVSASGAFHMQVPPGHWSLYGRELFGKRAGPSGCGGTQVSVKTDAIAIATFRCHGF